MTTCNAPITATPTDGEAFHTGRKLHRVECATHGLIHPGTTGPDHWSDAHRRTGEVWPVDRRAPTPTVAPGLDLDAVERAERAITPGPWRMHGYAAEIVDADDETVARLDMRGDRITGGDARVFSDAAGIVALRNAAPALIAEVRALRAEVAAAKWPKLRAEIARLTAELGAARAVPADVTEALHDYLAMFNSGGETLEAGKTLRTAIARAISDATDKRDAEWQKRIAPLHPNRTGDGCDSGDPIDWTFAALMLARIDVESDAHDEGHRAAMRDATAARETVGGLLATRCCSKCRGISSHTPGGIPCDECGLVGSMPWGG